MNEEHRLDDVAAHVVFGTDADLTGVPAAEVESLEYTAAAIARTVVPPVPVPAGLEARVHDAACGGGTGRAQTSWWATWGNRAGWAVAAVAMLALSVIGYRAIDLGVEARRDQFVRSAPDLLRVHWKTTSHPRAQSTGGFVSGNVVWSNAEQRGFFEVCHLAPNDPADGHYQLWILVDAEPETCVSAGIFDMQGGTLILPMDVLGHVSTAKAFLVTYEGPIAAATPNRENLVLEAGLTP